MKFYTLPLIHTKGGDILPTQPYIPPNYALLVTYDGILRDSNFFILRKILDTPSLKKQIGEYVDLTEIEPLSRERLEYVLLYRTKKNVLEWLAKKEFNYEANLEKLYYKYIEMFEDCRPLEMFTTLYQFTKHRMCRGLYIYSRYYDERIAYDIVKSIGDKNLVHYVTGNYLEVLDKLASKVDLVCDCDADRIYPLADFKDFRGKTLMLAAYGYNYDLVDDKYVVKHDLLERSVNNRVQLCMFQPIRLTKAHLGIKEEEKKK